MELLLATRNLHKIRELKEMLKPLGLDVVSLLDFPSYKAPHESGHTFEENALLKAKDAAQALHKWTLADDSGLIVPALGGAPGIFSARYAKEGATDQENRKKLLLELQGKEELQRSAYFTCVLALVSPEGEVKLFNSRCEGTILLQERGTNGFGYDSLFVKHGYQKSFAELDEGMKNRISHRRKAMDKLMLFLESHALH